MKTTLRTLGILLGIMSLAVHALAQGDSVYTLQKCIDYALAHNSTVLNAKLDVDISKQQVEEFRTIGLPQINGTVSILDNPELKRLFFQYVPGSPFAGAFPPTAQPGDVAGIPNFFQLRSSGDASLTGTQLLFSGSYLVGLKAATTLKELYSKSLTQTKIQTVESVTKAFYMVLINQERIELLNANIDRLDSLRRETKALQSKGFVENIDLDRLEVTYNNLVTEKEKFQNLIELTRHVLKFQMGYPVNSPLQIQGAVKEITKEQLNIGTGTVDPQTRNEYKLLLTQKTLYNLELRNTRSGYLPTLALFATGGYTRSDTRIGNLFTNTWYPYLYWGVNLNVPIFDSFKKMRQAQQSKLRISKIDNSLAAFENTVALQSKQAEINYKNSMSSLERQKKNLELAQEIVRVSKIKYQQGVGSNLEVVNAESSLREAQTNYYNALYDAMVYKIDYQSASGSLYNE